MNLEAEYNAKTPGRKGAGEKLGIARSALGRSAAFRPQKRTRANRLPNALLRSNLLRRERRAPRTRATTSLSSLAPHRMRGEGRGEGVSLLLSPALAAIPGTLVAWGWNDVGQTDIPAGLSNVVALAAGDAHSLALRSDVKAEPNGENSEVYRGGFLAGMSGRVLVNETIAKRLDLGEALA